MGTIWRGRIRFTVPMLFCLGWVFNFLIGGISGVFLSDVPSDVTTHGSFFSMAHFHYTIMGGLVFTLFAAIYYWGPKMTGVRFNERLAKIHFWSLFIAFNSTFAPLFALGFLGMPRRVVDLPDEPAGAQRLGLDIGVRDRAVDARLPGQRGLVAGLQARARRAQPVALEVAEWQLPTPVPLHDFDTLPGVRRAIRTRTAAERRRRAPRSRPRAERARRWKPPPPPLRTSSPSRASGSRARCGWAPGCCAAPRRSSSWRSCSPTSTCARWTATTAGRSARSPPRSGSAWRSPCRSS